MDCGCDPIPLGPSLSNTCGGGTFILFMSILNNFISQKCDISEVCSRIEPKNKPDAEYDFIVIGGGSGGSTAAGKLAEVTGWKVLLIEAGIDEPAGSQVPAMLSNFHGNPLMSWDYKTDPEKYGCQQFSDKRCPWTRAKVLGGCSVINGMMYTRGVPKDFDLWESKGNTGWGYDDVLPIFKRFEGNEEVGTLVEEAYHGTDGPLTVKRFNHQPELAYDILKAAAETGFPVTKDLNGQQFTGFAIAQASVRNAARLSSARTYIRPHRNNPNLHVMLNSTVTNIITESTFSGPIKATGVKFVYNGTEYSVKAKKEVILAAGAINSPQILQLSGIGPKKTIEKAKVQHILDLPGVGANFHNHVGFYLAYKLNETASSDLDWAKATEYLLYKTGPLSSSGMAQLTARLNTKYANPDGQYPDLQLFFGGYLASCGTSCDVVEHGDSPRTLAVLPVVLHPKSRGEIKIKSNDPFAPPSMYANYLAEPEDAATLVEGVRIIQKLMNSTWLRSEYGIELTEQEYGNCSTLHGYDTDAYWDCAVHYSVDPQNHQAGSCKMGPETDRMAVVNEKLEVHGINGLRIMDASVMPELISGNPHATIVLIAERGVDFIKEKYLTKRQTVIIENQ